MERGRANQFKRGTRGGRGDTRRGRGGYYGQDEENKEFNTQFNHMPRFSGQNEYADRNLYQQNSNILEEMKAQLRENNIDISPEILEKFQQFANIQPNNSLSRGRGFRGKNYRGRGSQNVGGQGNSSRIILDSGNNQKTEGGRARFFMNKELEQIREMTGQQIAQKLLDYKDLSASIDATKYSVRGYSHLINIWYKLCYDKSIQSAQLNLISVGFMESKFFERLQNDYINDLISNIRNLNDYKFRLDDLKLLFEIFMILIDKFKSKIHKIPIAIFAAFIRDDITLVQESCDLLNLHSLQVKGLQDMAIKLLEKRIQCLKDSKEEEKKLDQKQKQMQEEMKGGNYKIKPQDNFQDIDVVPTSHELLSGQQPFLRQMPEKGEFDDTHDYLDIVYRLLREDAIRPLREGIDVMKKFKPKQSPELSNYQIIKQLNRQMRDAGVRFYETTYLQNLSFTRNSPDVAITLRIYENGKSNWNASKRLLPGSLIILSKDNFKTLNLFLVCDRDAKKMADTSKKYKYVEIKIQHVSNEIQQNRMINLLNSDESDDEEDQYVRQLYNQKESPVLDFYLQHRDSQLKMIESTAYFESYYHVLKKLKQMDQWDSIPFAEYLTGQIKEDINEPIIFQQFENSNKRLNFLEAINQSIKKANFDQNQANALNTCMFKELAIIQGPPGTGKTYVGEHFVRILMETKQFWKKDKGPILLVCYTNHALDQFLNLIKKYTKNFVRIGGRSQDESLKNHSIQQFIKNNNVKYSRSFGQVIREIDDLVLKNCLNQTFSRPRFEDQYNIAINIVVQNLKNEPDMPVLFWLGLIDIQKYILNLREEIKLNNINQNQGLDFNEDDLNQRELEYEDMIEDNASYKNRIKEIKFIKQKYLNLTKHFHSDLSSDFFKGLNSQMECIKTGQQLGSTTKINFNDYPLFDQRIERRWQINNFYADPQDASSFKEISQLIQNYKIKYHRKQSLQSIAYCQAIQKADIVAMTTTGCAKNSELLIDVNFPIVIVEEAAEVFEGHILTALSQKTEHLVLIGDHQQLRPSPAVYEMEKEYNLHMSMFERLVKNDFEYTTLTNQRRMRPEISQMLRFLYPSLTDDNKVRNYPSIKGLDKNVFFMNHNQFEQEDEGLTSKLNKFEADVIIKFSNYLIQQNYKPSQITVLSLYQGQSFYIKKLVKEGYHKDDPINQIKVITVDNFQGEENDIVILSLVRSNAKNNIGYLKVSNRVCVALSRAKQGFYMFGNSKCLEQQDIKKLDEISKQFQKEAVQKIVTLDYLVVTNVKGFATIMRQQKQIKLAMTSKNVQRHAKEQIHVAILVKVNVLNVYRNFQTVQRIFKSQWANVVISIPSNVLKDTLPNANHFAIKKMYSKCQQDLTHLQACN
ncbi:UNKNOWN [Stylonychia lemnae]|uniref:Uncharacterized protein n=1 Tax=Stylonychia lemnae TaxID=5949 RepID=A0A078BBS4_STYLE|nr:UNKNOWN [Stylonychia lemnae]|eukprot:CDW91038.1 UNKNOWN [Stylonychia lemnae]